MCMLRTKPIKFKPKYSFSFFEFFLPGRDSNPDRQIPRKLAYQLTHSSALHNVKFNVKRYPSSK